MALPAEFWEANQFGVRVSAAGFQLPHLPLPEPSTGPEDPSVLRVGRSPSQGGVENAFMNTTLERSVARKPPAYRHYLSIISS